jgi:hypothetical protein
MVCPTATCAGNFKPRPTILAEDSIGGILSDARPRQGSVLMPAQAPQCFLPRRHEALRSPQHDLAMAEEDAELFEIGLAQLGQYRDVDGIVAERLRVPLQREPAQPSRRSPRTLQILRCPLA